VYLYDFYRLYSIELEKNAEKERNYREILQREVDELKRTLALACENIQMARLPRVYSDNIGDRTPKRITLRTGVEIHTERSNHDGLPASLAESESFCTATTSKSMSGEIRMKFETQGDILSIDLFSKLRRAEVQNLGETITRDRKLF
jgi:hypothetical protein